MPPKEVFKIFQNNQERLNETKYNLHYDDARGDFIRPPHTSLALRYFVLAFFSPFSIASTSLAEERANLCAFRTFIRFALVWFCLFPLPLGVWEGLRLDSYLLCLHNIRRYLVSV